MEEETLDYRRRTDPFELRAFDVRMEVEGVDRPFTWTNVEATSDLDALWLAIEEHYWPEYFDNAPSPIRMTVSVIPHADS